jgi:putative ABC transport system ATP-binding protein
LGGLDRPTSGTVRINGESIQGLSDRDLSIFRRRKLGFIFQFFNLVPTLNALENAALPALLDGRPLAQVKDRALDLLRWLEVDHRAENRPSQLSGGEMQRVAIARALLLEPPLILADEPTGNLDSRSGEKVLQLLQQMVREKGHTLLMVTHDSKAAAYGSRTIRIRDGQIESDQRA